MADTIREQIIAAFTTRAAALSTKAVERVRRSQPEGTERNVSVWDGEDVSESKEFGIQNLSFPIALHMQWDPGGGVNPSVSANAVMGETINTILSADTTFGGLATKTEYSSAAPEYPTDGGSFVSLTVIFTIYYSTVFGDPFTAPA